MELPASKRFAWAYTILFWVFILAVLFGSKSLATLAWIVLGVMFCGLGLAFVAKIARSWFTTSK